MENDPSEPDMHSEVQRYYGETLESSDDLKTTACCTVAAPPAHIARVLAEIHDEVSRRYYGCGLIIPEALEGLRVLDLGCGAGRDVYLLSRLVGPEGHVTGVDMTPEQLDVAREHIDFHTERYGYQHPNVDFVQANIEALDQAGLVAGSYDVIVSNCVINLAVDKASVLRSAHQLLKPGGEMYFSDIYSSRRVPEALQTDPVLYGECLAGALYWNDFVGLAREAGFADARLVSDESVDVTDAALQAKVGDLGFRSATVRLFRIAGLEAWQEDYDQRATYLGTIPEQAAEFRLDAEHVFPAGEPMPVSGNTAKLLAGSRFSRFFSIIGDDSHHLGTFNNESAGLIFTDADSGASGSGCC